MNGSESWRFAMLGSSLCRVVVGHQQPSSRSCRKKTGREEPQPRGKDNGGGSPNRAVRPPAMGRLGGGEGNVGNAPGIDGRGHAFAATHRGGGFFLLLIDVHLLHLSAGLVGHLSIFSGVVERRCCACASCKRKRQTRECSFWARRGSSKRGRVLQVKWLLLGKAKDIIRAIQVIK